MKLENNFHDGKLTDKMELLLESSWIYGIGYIFKYNELNNWRILE